MDVQQAQIEAKRLGRLAFLATVRPDGRPHAVPVVVAWHDDRVLGFVATSSVKVANLRVNPKLMVHWQVSQDTNMDSLIVEGDAEVIDTTDGRRALWGAMGYDLAPFEPGGPEADSHVFISLDPQRITFLKMYGAQGREVWTKPAN
jgi:nitroimidazol reductase NimA-like FMN-containing flavoprotein (pyridoxamine 5'-phosphate oxidase superfamily)